MSPPAQNALPVPVITIARTAASPTSFGTFASMPALTAGESAFIASGIIEAQDGDGAMALDLHGFGHGGSSIVLNFPTRRIQALQLYTDVGGREEPEGVAARSRRILA